MKYIIFEKGQLKEVAYNDYQQWMEHEADNLTLPSLTEIKEGITYTIDTDYHGVFDKEDLIRPFVLFHSTNDVTTVEHFYSMEELMAKRQQLINRLAAKAA